MVDLGQRWWFSATWARSMIRSVYAVKSVNPVSFLMQ
jgi:hypothetical protein